jgi:translocation and assembly module TamA
VKTTLLAVLCTDFLWFLFAGTAVAQAAEHQRYRVQIEAPGELRDMLQKGLNLVRWQNDEGLTPALLERLVEEAVRETRQAAAAEGWFAAKVESRIERESEPWTVTLRVDPGPRTQISSVDLAITGPVTEDPDARKRLENVRKQWTLRTGQPFRQGAWDAAKQKALTDLSVWRYAAARIADSKAVIDPNAHTAALSLTLDSGPPFRFGAIEVSGVKRYSEKIVRNLSTIESGKPFDRDELLNYERRLLEAGYFISAHAVVDPDTAKADAVPVRVAVIEGPSQNLDVGLQINTDAGFRPELHYKNADFFDSSTRLRADLQTDLKVQRSSVNFDLPPRSNGRWLNPFVRTERSDVENLQTTEFAVGVGLNHGAISTPSGPVVSYHIEHHKVSGAETDYRRALFLAYRYAFRETDDLLQPRKGYIGTASIGFAPDGLSTRRFSRAQARAALLQPLGSDDLLVRGELGAVLAQSRAGIPSTFLFRTGGDQTVRGYAFESIGIPEGDAIVGGRYLAVASVEATHWIGANWGIAVFVDAGDAWDQAGKFDPALGYGFGGRVRTPIGPIRADIAYGERTHKIRLHFSIGFTF